MDTMKTRKPRNILGNVIKDVRRERHLTQSQLSKLTGFAQNTISQHENKLRELTENDLSAYARALNVNPIYFYERLDGSASEKSAIIASNEKSNYLYNEILRKSQRLSIDNMSAVLDYINFKLTQKQ